MPGELNLLMLSCLVRAIQEHAVATDGERLSQEGVNGVLSASLREGPEGFLPETLWRALEIAAEDYDV